MSSDTDPLPGPKPADLFEPLDPSARWLFHAQAIAQLFMFWGPVIAAGTFGGAVLLSPTPAIALGAVALLVAFLLSVWWPQLSFDRWGYAVREGELLIASGVLFRSVVAIPLSRVQHVDVRQGPLEQWLSLGRLYVHTASGLGSDGVIPGLQMATALQLRDRLVAASNRSDDGV